MRLDWYSQLPAILDEGIVVLVREFGVNRLLFRTTDVESSEYLTESLTSWGAEY